MRNLLCVIAGIFIDKFQGDKMKLKVFIIAIFVAAVSVTAQVRTGVEAGVNVSHGFDTSKTRAGFNVGLTGEYGFADNWLVDAALKLSSQPCADSFMAGFDNPGSSMTANMELSYTPYYLTLPVRIGYRMSIAGDMKVTVGVGPMIGAGLFGRGHVRSTVAGNAAASVDYKINNVFKSDRNDGFS